MEAPEKPTHPPAAGVQKQRRILSCTWCQSRKIKCDRLYPCSNCIKANQVCMESKPAPTRKRRRPNQDLQERLARCESLLKQYADSPAPQEGVAAASPADTVNSARTPATTEDHYLNWKPAGKVEEKDGNVRFMDSHLWAGIYEELKAMRGILETEDFEDQCGFSTPGELQVSENEVDLIFDNNTNEKLDDLIPSPGHIVQLWQLYIDRVNPLYKIVHVPSTQQLVVDAATNPSCVSMKVHAVLFAIYCSATVTLTEVESQKLLGQSQETAIHRFSTGFRFCLRKSNFLQTYDFTTLQALSVYLSSMHNRFSPHSSWVINGVLLRIAQKLGLHRDGEHLGLTPFETEMQRRMWWHIVMQDIMFGIHSGLTQFHLPVSWDTKQPQNLNDTDMIPGLTEPLRGREGPTEMAFQLITLHLGRFFLGMDGMSGLEAIVMGQNLSASESPNAPDMDTINKYRESFEKLDAELKDIEDRYVDLAAGPIHAVAKMIRPVVVKKMIDMITPLQTQPEWGTEIFGTKDNLFKMAVESSEQGVSLYEILVDGGFLWFAKLNFQTDVFAVMLGQLRHRVQGNLVDRAWRVVDQVYSYHPELTDMRKRSNISAGIFALKGWKARESRLRTMGQPIIVPDCILRLRDIIPSGGDMRSTYTTPESATSDNDRKLGSNMVSPGFTQTDRYGTHTATSAMPIFDGFGPFLDTSTGLGMDGLDWDMFGDLNLSDPQASASQGPMAGVMFPGMGHPNTGLPW